MHDQPGWSQPDGWALLTVETSVPDPWHLGTEPDPWIRTLDLRFTDPAPAPDPALVSDSEMPTKKS